MTMTNLEQTKVHFWDAAAIANMFAALVGWLPAIAALLSIVWTLIRIYETTTFQAALSWVRRKLG